MAESLVGDRLAIVERFQDLVCRADAGIHVPAAALAIAGVAYPDLEAEAWLADLEALGEAAHHAVASRGDVGAVQALSGFVFSELAFRGNHENYYDPRNSYLNDVLERRLGIPITLALVYIELGRAAGLEIEGVGFPGHFLVRDCASGVLLDVFSGGTEMTQQDCLALLKRLGVSVSEWSEDLVAACPPSHILARMLNNLRLHYESVGDSISLAAVGAMLEVLSAAHRDGSPGMVH